MATKKEDGGGALATINKDLRVKEEIDRPFDALEIVGKDVEISPNAQNAEDEEIYNLEYHIKNDYFGLNVISHLNLGRAYKLENNDEGDKFEYNISPDAKRVKFPASEQNVYNEKWVDHVFKTISGSPYSAVILENVFSRVTSGNYEKILPYQEQLRIIYKKIKEYKIENKIIALVRGTRETEIIDNGGPDLMKMLGEVLGIKDRVTGKKVVISMRLDDGYKPDAKIRLTNFNPNGRITKGIFKKVIDYIEKEEPGFDIYWNTTAKISGQEDTFMTHDREHPEIKKPCTAIFFGPMCEYDLLNANREGLPAYTLNHMWYKTCFEHSMIDGQICSKVKTHFNDYNAPSEEKVDNANYVSSVISDSIGEALECLSKIGTSEITSTIEDVVGKTRKSFNQYMSKQKTNNLRAEDERTNGSAIIKDGKTNKACEKATDQGKE